MSKIIRKAVIPAAGLGTRFLPATKAVPKELLPIVDVPTIQYIVEEAVTAGIEIVIIITGRGKGAIEDHFDVHSELEERLERDGKEDLLAHLRKSTAPLELVSVRQGRPLGLGHAVLCAKEVVGAEPFAVLVGDDIVDAEVPCIGQMIEVFERHRQSVLAVMEVAPHEISRFGAIGGTDIEERITKISEMVEKPAMEQAHSNNAIVGRYILMPEIFELLEKTGRGAGGEIQLTDAMAELMRMQGFLGYRFSGTRYDAGDKFGFLQATIAYALKRPEFAEPLREFMRGLV